MNPEKHLQKIEGGATSEQAKITLEKVAKDKVDLGSLITELAEIEKESYPEGQQFGKERLENLFSELGELNSGYGCYLVKINNELGGMFFVLPRKTLRQDGEKKDLVIPEDSVWGKDETILYIAEFMLKKDVRGLGANPFELPKKMFGKILQVAQAKGLNIETRPRGKSSYIMLERIRRTAEKKGSYEGWTMKMFPLKNSSGDEIIERIGPEGDQEEYRWYRIEEPKLAEVEIGELKKAA